MNGPQPSNSIRRSPLPANSLHPDEWWQPIDRQQLTRAESAHLYRRAAFGATTRELDAAGRRPLHELIDDLFSTPDSDEFERQSQAMKEVVRAGNAQTQLPAWWLYRLLHSPRPAIEKLVLFWHGHFATSAAKVNSAGLMLDQFETFHRRCLGPFEQLVLAISRDPAMLIYLDSATNRRSHPNENYARELLELFCLGLGQYSERDIRELAKAFTGWEIQNGEFKFNAFQHDPGPKNILGNAKIESGEQAVAWIVSQPAAATFIVQKLFRFYVSDEPASPEFVQPLADTLRNNGFEILPALKQIFASRIFYSDLAIARKIRSPVELGVGLLRCLNATTSPVRLASSLDRLGQRLFYPPNVKGWDGGRHWINSATMIGRMNMATELLQHNETRFGVDKRQLDSEWGASDAANAVRLVEELWLPQPLEESQRRQLATVVDRAVRARNSRLLTAFQAAATLAEFQLG